MINLKKAIKSIICDKIIFNLEFNSIDDIVYILPFLGYCLFIGFVSLILFTDIIYCEIDQINILCTIFFTMVLISLIIKQLKNNFPKYHIVMAATLFVISISFKFLASFFI